MIGLFLPRRSETAQDRDPLSNFWYGPVGRSVASGVVVTDETAMNYSAVWAATRLLSGTGGWLPTNLYRKKGARGKMIADDDPRNALVETRPNPNMIPMLWKSQGFKQQINAGNAYYEIQRYQDGRGIYALWPIHESRVTAFIDGESSELAYKVKNNNAEPSFIKAKDMLHFPSCISDDGIVGKGVIRHARESIGMGIATERSGASFFGSGGMPRIIVESPKKWSPDSRANFRKEWSEVYGGPDGSDVGIIDEGAKLHMLNISQQDSQFLETRQFNIEEIARWYGVPPHKLQQLLRATFSNIEHQSIEFVTESLMPWLVIWEQELDKKLLTEEEQQTMFFRFNVSEILRGDAKTRSERIGNLVGKGVITRNEGRWEEDYNEAEGGDTFLVQGAMVALDSAGVPQPPAASVSPDTATVPEDAPAVAMPVEPAPRAEIAVEAAMKAMLEGCLSRMIRKETTAARRASNKPKFMKWAEDFFGKHEPQLTEALDEVAPAMHAMDIAFDVKSFSKDHCDESGRALIELCTATEPESFSDAVDELMTRWERDRAASAVARIFERKGE